MLKIGSTINYNPESNTMRENQSVDRVCCVSLDNVAELISTKRQKFDELRIRAWEQQRTNTKVKEQEVCAAFTKETRLMM